MLLEGTVTGGVVVFDNGSVPPEGTRVEVVIRPSSAQVAPATEGLPDLSDIEPPDDLDVEKDIYVRMPRRYEKIEGAIIREGTGLKPTLIFPEELPDE